MFFKKKKPTPQSSTYRQTMQTIHLFLNNVSTQEEKLHILNTVAEIIKNDIKYSWLSDIIYKENIREIRGFFPCFQFKDENGKQIETRMFKEKQIDLRKDIVIAIPHRKYSFIRQMTQLHKNDFVFSETNHLGVYVKGLDISYVYNGIHSVVGGILNKKGYILLDVLDITKLYNHIYFDGDYVYDSHKKEKIGNLCDYRLAVLFEISKLKDEINFFVTD